MRLKLKPILFSLAAFVPVLAIADNKHSSTNPEIDKDIHKIALETEALQKEVRQLKSQINSLKSKKQQHGKASKSNPTPAPEQEVSSTTGYSPVGYSATGIPRVQYHYHHHHVAPISELYSRGVTVTTSPYIGLRSAYDASDVIVNISSMNEDLRLLKQRRANVNHLCELGVPITFIDRPVVEISGKVEANATVSRPFDGGRSSDTNLASAQLDIFVEASPWALAFMSLQTDTQRLPTSIAGEGSRVRNSRIFLKRGFVTIGNLNYSPFYLTAGQFFVPFGSYASYMLSDTMPKLLGRTNSRAVLLGVTMNGMYASGYVFRGDTDVDTGINNGGLNFGYNYESGKFKIDFGAGLISNIAESEVMQFTGRNFRDGFPGFGFSLETENIHRRVPAVDFHAELNYGAVGLKAEYIDTTNSFSRKDLTFNTNFDDFRKSRLKDDHDKDDHDKDDHGKDDHGKDDHGRDDGNHRFKDDKDKKDFILDGAHPAALHLEADYDFSIFTKPANFGVAFDHSWELLGLAVPESSYIAVFNISLWKNTIESLEFRHDMDYSRSDFSIGRCELGDATNKDCQNSIVINDDKRKNDLARVVRGTGDSANTLTAQIGVYW